MFQKEIRVPWLWRLHFSGNKPELWKFYTQLSTEIYKSLVLLRKNIGFLTEMVNYGTYSLFSGRNFRKKDSTIILRFRPTDLGFFAQW